MHLKRFTLLASISLSLTGCAPRGAMEPNSQSPSSQRSVSMVRLYLPDDLMAQRVNNVQPLSDYLKSVEQRTDEFWKKNEKPAAKGLLIVVGVKPGGKSRVWCESVEADAQIDETTIQALQKELEAISPVAVQNGPIAVALNYCFTGDRSVKFPVLPKVWSDAAKSSKEDLMIPDGMFKLVWPD